MTLPDKPTLKQCERAIERCYSRFEKDAGKILLVIHEQRLYRDKYKSFDTYLDERWAISRATGYRMLDGAKALLAAEEQTAIEAGKEQVTDSRVSQDETNTSDDLPKGDAIDTTGVELPNTHLIEPPPEAESSPGNGSQAAPDQGPGGEATDVYADGASPVGSEITAPQEPPAQPELELEDYLALIEAERERRPAEARLADEIRRLRAPAEAEAPARKLKAQELTLAAESMVMTGTESAAIAMGLALTRDLSNWAQRAERAAIRLSADKTVARYREQNPTTTAPVARREVTPNFKGGNKK